MQGLDWKFVKKHKDLYEETIENYCSGSLKNIRKAGSLQTKWKEITDSV